MPEDAQRIETGQDSPSKPDGSEPQGEGVAPSGRSGGCGNQDARRRQAVRLDLLAGLAESLLSNPDPDAALLRLCHAAQSELGVDICLSHVIDGPPEDPRQPRTPRLTFAFGVPPGDSVCCPANPYGNAELGHRAVSADWLRAVGGRACVGVPIHSRGRLAGLLSFGSRGRDAFDPDDIAFFSAVAHQIAGVRERLRVEAALRASEDHYRHMVDLNPQTPWTASPDGSVLEVSERWLRLTGITLSEALGEGWQKLHHPDDLQRAQVAWRRSLETGEPYDVERRTRMADGSFRWMRSRAFPRRDAEGRIVRWYGTVEDIDDRKKAELSLKAATAEAEAARREAEAASRAKSRFLASASHDLRQPVQSLFMFAGALAAGDLGSRERAQVAEIVRSLGALKDLLDALLDMSRLDAGVVEPRFRTVPIQDVFSKLQAGVAARAERRRLGFRMVPCDATVRTDPVLFIRMLGNLLDNALRFTERGRILVACRRRGEHLAVQVWDTGLGMPEGRLEEVFEEFVQLDNPHRDRSQGLGLGLAIVRRLCDLLGHRITVRSVQGRGSVFEIQLPLASPADTPAPPPPVAPLKGPCGRILAIDDEVIVLMGLQAMLETWGHHVVPAHSGSEAVRLLTASGARPDLVLADYRLLNGETGPDAVSLVRRHLGFEVPALLLTGDTSTEVQAGAHRIGAGLLHKPVLPRELQGAIRSLLVGKPA
ncbi:MAG TPA: ATP-binding protein [Azospirillaceae bacterium]|nr:ATP-binding protein [Azospirillaceae bacterium]